MPKLSEEIIKKNKQHIIDIATRLFVEKGYNKTSINDIVKKAGMSKGGFYNYYSSKESLFFEMIHGADESIIHYGQDIMDSSDEDPFAAYISFRLKRFFEEENRIRAKYTFEFWTSSSLSHDQIHALNVRYEAFKKDVMQLLKSLDEFGIYRLDELETLSQLLLATLDGIIFTDTVLHRRINEDLINMTVNVFKSYLKGAKA